MENKRKTFLSYSRLNKDFAVKLARELKSEGFSVWLDQLDIPPGARWDVEVEKALVESDIFMVIITKGSSTSENVLDEIGYAIDNGKRLLPVLLEKTNIPLRLRRFQYVDFTDKSFDDGLQSAKELLRNLIAQPTVPRKDLPAEIEAAAAAVNKQQIEPDLPAKGKAENQNVAESSVFSDTAVLRREKVEQELRFKAEEARLMQEKAALEKQLQEERSTHDRIQPVATKPRSRAYLTFGVAAVVILVSGFLLTKFVPGILSASKAPSNNEIPTSAATAVLIPITSNDATATVVLPTLTPTEAFTATPASSIEDEKGAAMILIPAGEFQMGSGRGEADEQPVHAVYLDAFYIDKFEVTNELYAACVDAGKCEPPTQTYFFPESPNQTYYGNTDYDNYPVIYVTWNMAKAYCEWRGARLPTEAEWEKAARGTSGNPYPWGKDLDCHKANFQKCVNRTTAVGSFADGVSPYGVYDMTGNVWEWVADWYSHDYYSISTKNNPPGPNFGQSRVVRGGSWARFDVTAFHRGNFAPSYNTFDIGFRCAGSQ